MLNYSEAEHQVLPWEEPPRLPIERQKLTSAILGPAGRVSKLALVGGNSRRQRVSETDVLVETGTCNGHGRPAMSASIADGRFCRFE